MGSDTAPGRRRDLTGWNIAAALGLLAAAFLVERLAPARERGLSRSGRRSGMPRCSV